MLIQYEDLSKSVIGAAIEVHKKLGPGFLESIYERALVIELSLRGIRFERQAQGLLLNFGTSTLQIKRVYSNRSMSPAETLEMPDAIAQDIAT